MRAEVEGSLRRQDVRNSRGARIAVFDPLLAWAPWIGLNPNPYFKVLERPTAQIVERVRPGYYAEHHLANPLSGGVVAER